MRLINNINIITIAEFEAINPKSGKFKSYLYYLSRFGTPDLKIHLIKYIHEENKLIKIILDKNFLIEGKLIALEKLTSLNGLIRILISSKDYNIWHKVINILYRKFDKSVSSKNINKIKEYLDVQLKINDNSDKVNEIKKYLDKIELNINYSEDKINDNRNKLNIELEEYRNEVEILKNKLKEQKDTNFLLEEKLEINRNQLNNVLKPIEPIKSFDVRVSLLLDILKNYKVDSSALKDFKQCKNDKDITNRIIRDIIYIDKEYPIIPSEMEYEKYQANKDVTEIHITDKFRIYLLQKQRRILRIDLKHQHDIMEKYFKDKSYK